MLCCARKRSVCGAAVSSFRPDDSRSGRTPSDRVELVCTVPSRCLQSLVCASYEFTSATESYVGRSIETGPGAALARRSAEDDGVERSAWWAGERSIGGCRVGHGGRNNRGYEQRIGHPDGRRIVSRLLRWRPLLRRRYRRRLLIDRTPVRGLMVEHDERVLDRTDERRRLGPGPGVALHAREQPAQGAALVGSAEVGPRVDRRRSDQVDEEGLWESALSGQPCDEPRACTRSTG